MPINTTVNNWIGDPLGLAKLQLGQLAATPPYMVSPTAAANAVPSPGGIQMVGNPGASTWIPGKSPDAVNGLPTRPMAGDIATIYFDGTGWHVIPLSAQTAKNGSKPPMAPPATGITLEQLHEAQDFIEKEIEAEKIHACAA